MNPNISPCRIPPLPFWFRTAVVAFTACIGCESSHDPLWIDAKPPVEKLIEFDLGKYVIPIPATLNEKVGPARRNVMQLEFAMHAIVNESQEPRLAKTWEKNAGRFRDRAIELCRTTSIDDLREPGLETLKSRLLDAVKPVFGRDSVDRLVLTDVQYQTLE
jgi:hypothetical protein